MDLSAFRASLASASPPAGLSHALRALWLDARGDWTARMKPRRRTRVGRPIGFSLQRHRFMIGHQVPLFHPAFSLFRELSENFPQMLAQLAVQDFTSKIRDENDVIFALPLWVT